MLHTLRPSPGARQRRKRVGRGISAGGGKTAGRGTKGQHARAGKGRRFGFEGGQTPLLRRQPKLGGFRNPHRIVYQVLNLERIEQRLEAGSYNLETLRSHKLIHGTHPVKLLGKGTLTKKLTLTVHSASKSARRAVEKVGGRIDLIKRQNLTPNT
ncbi:50S ribosomal protein L15 [Candidatus Peribacteria bacterium RIFCSPLOWO2_12_FULL_55_15]|nr:MAG: 50S ribosomal protein L15 [Candidatus Peribacteria bacterium RIFCSPHIGHO2_01_FULL_54_22]OGJ63015.1 MAG: 50S ribosomal protein L15 [Candidatus Peribacteria bacterium RIFCSPHIGHO2_02_FULL_55_24]OGJ63919.1 MAG: 50S ribosomal protein L15 [Candidatus Peribacteria bacterium RIFCSPHIGHO2_12_FULL_54_10]OGJ68619.1 MAG: 50S ribosomal protein L15 [Candidatus Peribacteria bacterium RIFCSPLOWO2_01_FULL_54_110]OGJ68840.1 MAG: 50S ribosomal protein L15 [Candidatus Peribacteria bacterium RIFCSPLOWO2_02